MTKLILFLSISAMGLSVLASDEPVERSSHPRGIAIGGALPQMMTPSGSAAAVGGGTMQDTADLPDRPAATPVARQATTGGVAVTGATRIDARVQSGTATAVGEQNTSGNRTGGIGGK